MDEAAPLTVPPEIRAFAALHGGIGRGYLAQISPQTWLLRTDSRLFVFVYDPKDGVWKGYCCGDNTGR